MEALSPGEPLEVAIVLESPSLPRLRDLDRGSTDLSDGLADLEAAIAPARSSLLALFNATGEVSSVSAPEFSPVIEVVATARFVGEELSKRVEVRRVELTGPGELASPDLGFEGETLDFLFLGAIGGTSPLAIIEPGSGVHPDMIGGTLLPTDLVQQIANGSCSIATEMADCAPEGTPETFCYCRGSLLANQHTEQVAAITSSSECLGAFGAPLRIANGGNLSPPSLTPPLMWAVADQGASVANFSLLGGSSSFYNSFAVTYGVLIVKGSGNGSNGTGACPLGNCEASCPGLNSLCVSGYDARGTFGFLNFSDDVEFEFPDINNPAGQWMNWDSSDRELPDIVGPYFVSVPTCATAACGNQLNEGTSFATAFVSLLAKLIIGRDEAALAFRPEAVMAILLASTVGHDITAPPISTYVPPDQRDGAGSPRGSIALSIVDDITFLAETAVPADFVAGVWSSSVTVPLVLGDVLRVTLAWSHCPDALWCSVEVPGGLPDTFPCADPNLGLRVIAPDGSLRKLSVGFDAAREILQMEADAAGIYTIEVILSDPASWSSPCPGRGLGFEDSVDIGLAWHVSM